MENDETKLEALANSVALLAGQLCSAGRYDLLFRALGAPVLEELRIEAARSQLSRLVITKDYRFVLQDMNCEVKLSPVHKAIYMLFLNHPEGIEFKRLADYRGELLGLYCKMSNRIDKAVIEESVDRLTSPLDNAINEKCSRIKHAFSELMDSYRASYYVIGSHVRCPVGGVGKVWYRRLKQISLPRELVVYE